MMTYQEFNFNIYSTHFYGQYWQPSKTKAIILLVHGMGEHATRYTESVIPKLTENGFGVIAFDQFGHGKTSGKRGHCPSFEAVLKSVEKVQEKALAIFGNKPLFLYGHSMGGNVVINYVLRKKHSFAGVIATSPFLQLAFQPPAIKLFVGKLLQKIAPAITMGNELDPNDVSRDNTEVQKYMNDPLVHDRISPNFSITFIETGKWAIENANKLQTPTLLLHGTDDKIIDYKGTQEFSNNSNTTTLKLYEGGYHELHNDLCKEEMLTDVVNWLKKQL
ncbi:MAG: lysophospholipase [Polaribacter sp.]|nr:lysophospholipase [Polaribacter sp.]